MDALILVEACVASLASARAAVDAGAGRLELCGPGEGGITPSRALLDAVMREVRVPVHVMVRPREGDFVYTDDELREMREAIAMAQGIGAAGAVFGALQPDGALDVDAMRELVDLARPLRVACHRAFDRTPDADQALDQLMDLGVDLVLTSGHASTALEGVETLVRLVRRAAGDITILAGGSVRAANVREIVERTGIREVHARATDPQVFASLVAAARELR